MAPSPIETGTFDPLRKVAAADRLWPHRRRRLRTAIETGHPGHLWIRAL